MVKDNIILLFDVDGTLTPTRSKIDPAFAAWFRQEIKWRYAVVTGSDHAKTREQLGEELFNSSNVFCCCANDYWSNGRNIWSVDWSPPQDLVDWLSHKIIDSSWSIHTGRHIESRVGLINFSVLGRNATIEQRKAYYIWDQLALERAKLATELVDRWPDIAATIAGETGIDIYPEGFGKERILQFVTPGYLDNPEYYVHFFADRTEPGGNDHSLAQAIITHDLGEVHTVKDWQECWSILLELKKQKG